MQDFHVFDLLRIAPSPCLLLDRCQFLLHGICHEQAQTNRANVQLVYKAMLSLYDFALPRNAATLLMA